MARQRTQTPFEVGRQLAGVPDQSFAVDDVEIRQSGSARHRMAGIGEAVIQREILAGIDQGLVDAFMQNHATEVHGDCRCTFASFTHLLERGPDGPNEGIGAQMLAHSGAEQLVLLYFALSSELPWTHEHCSMPESKGGVQLKAMPLPLFFWTGAARNLSRVYESSSHHNTSGAGFMALRELLLLHGLLVTLGTKTPRLTRANPG